MRTMENAANLDGATLEPMMRRVRRLDARPAGARGRVHRSAGRRDPAAARIGATTRAPGRSTSSTRSRVTQALPRFDQIVHSWDTAVKDKTTATIAPARLGLRRRRPLSCSVSGMSTPGSSRRRATMRELHEWSATLAAGPRSASIVEAAGLGPDIVKQLEREVQGLRAIAAKGDKVQRVWAASPALESHHCFLPGQAKRSRIATSSRRRRRRSRRSWRSARCSAAT